MNNKILIILTLLTAIIDTAKSQWIEIPTNSSYGLQSVSAIDDNNVWVAGASIFRSTNAGTNWINATGSGISSNAQIYNIFAIDQLTAIISGVIIGSPDKGISYKTTNGGNSWYTVFLQDNGFVDAVWMRNQTEGILIGDPVNNYWSIYKTTSSGNNWFQSGVVNAGVGESGVVNSLYVLGDNVWFGANTNPWLYYSSNFGTSWVKQEISGTQGVYAIYFINANTGMCGGVNNINLTTNSGNNWISLTYPGTGAVNGIAGNGSFWLISKLGVTVYSSSNSGTNWAIEYQVQDGTQRTQMSKSRTGTRVWETRTNGKVARRDGALGINLISNEIPLQNSLEQNYPNPFNPETNIRFMISKASFVNINLYDINGKVVSNLLKEFMSSGTYSITFNSSGLSSGIYYYTLSTENFIETKKMVLVK